MWNTSVILLNQGLQKLLLNIKRLFGAWFHPTSFQSSILQEFLKDFCEDEVFLQERRKILRMKAGLTDKDKNKVICLRFRIWDVCKF